MIEFTPEIPEDAVEQRLTAVNQFLLSQQPENNFYFYNDFYKLY